MVITKKNYRYQRFRARWKLRLSNDWTSEPAILFLLAKHKNYEAYSEGWQK